MSQHYPNRQYLNHAVPYWVDTKGHNAFFITVCCKNRYKNQLCDCSTWNIIEESVRTRQERQDWSCSLFLAMPDHVHAILRFPTFERMPEIIRDWKRWISRTTEVEWQNNFYDHRIRSIESGVEKREYILDNPVRAKLTNDRETWPYKIDFLAERSSEQSK